MLHQNVKIMKQALLFCMILLTTIIIQAQPPYSGTIFIDPDIITSSDPSAIQSTTYTGQGMVTMFDRRVSDWVTVNAYLFDVIWDDGLTSIAQVNSEFSNITEATVEAKKYAFLIGQLPNDLRENIDEIWIHQGIELFGGATNAILIHTGQSIIYENDGIIEETLIHEASHTSLDPSHATSSDWINAQNQDDEFISIYAQDNPLREDIAETFLTWLAVRYRPNKISVQDYNSITETIPSRLSYFDSFNFNLYPFEARVLDIHNFESQDFTIYPNPATDVIRLKGSDLNKNDIKIYNVLGQDFTHLTLFENNTIDILQLPTGYYTLKAKTFVRKMYKK